jgi:hypothetical protein
MTYLRMAVTASAALWLAVSISTTARAANMSCPPLASKAVTGDSDLSTTSQTFVNVASTKISFVQGGSKAGCVAVTFAAEAESAANEIMVVHALLDDVTPCSPDIVDFVGSSTAATSDAARSMTFICPAVAPGSHSIRMQYLSDGGGMVTLTRRTTIVYYVP